MNRSILSLAATIALTGSSQAAGLVDNFESYNAVLDDMNGKGGWTVANPTGPEGPVVIVDSYTWDLSNRSATVGGVPQTTLGISSLDHSVTGVQLGYASVKWEMAYTESTVVPRNPYQFVVQVGAQNLLTLDLTPAVAANQYTLAWDSSLDPSGTTGAFGLITANTSTQIQLDTFWNGTKVQYALTNAGAPVSSGILNTASQFDSIGLFSAKWNSTGGAGNGSVTIDNVSIIPEASSAMLGLLGATFAFVRRRRP